MASDRDKASKNPYDPPRQASGLGHKSTRRRVKMRLQVVQLLVVLIGLACSLFTILGIAPVADGFPEEAGKVIWPLVGLASMLIFMLSARLLIRLCVALGIMTNEEAADFPGLVRRKRGYAESWLEPPVPLAP